METCWQIPRDRMMMTGYAMHGVEEEKDFNFFVPQGELQARILIDDDENLKTFHSNDDQR